MKRFLYKTGCVLLITLLISCGGNTKSISEKDNDKTNKTESDSNSENSTNEETKFVSEQKTINGQFLMVALSTDGAIYLVNDENGNEYDFYDRNPEAKGLDFLNGYNGNEPLDALENDWFEITYENRMLEFYDGSIAEYFDREELVIIEVKSTQAPLNKSKSDNLSFEIIKSLDVNGTEPFWAISLYEEYAIFNSPEISDLKLYYLVKFDEDMGFCSLVDAIEPQKDGSVTLRLQEEGTSDITKLTISKGECSDGMSENKYDYTVLYQWNDNHGFQGCGNTRTK